LVLDLRDREVGHGEDDQDEGNSGDGAVAEVESRAFAPPVGERGT
jgi:hypothetical protein